MERLRAEPDPAQRYPAAVARLRALIAADAAPTLVEAVDRLLERVALSTSREAEVDAHRVNLLTLHSTKGLEFSRVYVVGVEDFQIPGYYQIVDNREDEIQEARRLLYVGMTRACDRLVLTYTTQRAGRPSGEHRFLDEMRITPA
jgi:DNA helicase-2/ATP-dependent DNA helicase PcrA